jgi:hypothetical protein
MRIARIEVSALIRQCCQEGWHNKERVPGILALFYYTNDYFSMNNRGIALSAPPSAAE